MKRPSTAIQAQGGCGSNYICVTQGKAFAVGILFATIFTKARAERILRQAEELPVGEPAEKLLLVSNVLVHASHVLIGISTRTRSCREVVRQRIVGWQRKKAKQVGGSRINASWTG